MPIVMRQARITVINGIVYVGGGIGGGYDDDHLSSKYHPVKNGALYHLLP